MIFPQVRSYLSEHGIACKHDITHRHLLRKNENCRCRHYPAIQGNLAAHDPSLIKQGSTYYVFSTGGGIQIRTSPDLVTWTYTRTVFSSIPSWVTSYVGSITNLWAPDISYHNGVYYLYYAGSTFGSNTTLDPSSSSYHWVDQGRPGRRERSGFLPRSMHPHFVN